MSVKFDPKTVQPTKPKALEPTQIYTLLDARARDWRQIMIAGLAAIVASVIAAINSLHPGMTLLDSIKSVGLFAIAIAIACLIFFKIRPEVRETITRAEFIRANYIPNWDKVPPVDGFLPRPLRKKGWPNSLGAVTAEDWTSPDAQIKQS